jgi:putative spermidine/putrescine transport system substrate-binding protein
LIPGFEKQYPHVKVDYVFDSHGIDDVTTLAKVALAEKERRTSGYALLESATTAVEVAAREKLFIPVTAAAVPNSVNVPASSMSIVKSDAIPYRGSKVVLAYNSSTVTNPPKTLDALLAWITANPGKFAYCAPQDGGSGAYFVQAVLDKYMKQSDINTLAFNYVPSLESSWTAGMAELHSLNSSVYGGGTYPTGNTQVLALLASGAVQMATVWSDQSIAGLNNGSLPKNIKLLDLTPPFAGSPVYLGVPKYTPKNQVVAVDAFLNYVLSTPQQAKVVNTLAGFPGIKTSLLPAEKKSEFAPIGTKLQFPFDANAGSDMNRIWAQDVP